MAERAGAETDGLHEVALANSGLTDENDIDAPSDELCGGELFVLVTADGPVEVPVEGLESFVLGESCGVDAALDGALESARSLCAYVARSPSIREASSLP